MKKSSIVNRFLTCIFISITISSGQIWDIEWEKSFKNLQITGMIINKKGNFVISRIDTMKMMEIDHKGTILWEKNYEDITGFENHGGKVVQQTSDGGYLILGRGGMDWPKSFLIKTDSLGNQLLGKCYDYDLYGKSSESFSKTRMVDAIETKDGGFMLAGQLAGNRALIRLNSQGDTIWTKMYPSPVTYRDTRLIDMTNVSQRGDGTFLAAGTRMRADHDIEGAVSAIDDNGNVIWEKVFPPAYYEVIVMQKQPDGGCIINENRGSNPHIHRLDNKGNTIWEHDFTDTFPVNDHPVFFHIQLLPDNLHLLTGGYRTHALTGFLDTNGKFVYTKVYPNREAITFPAAITKNWFAVMMSDSGYVYQYLDKYSLNYPPYFKTKASDLINETLEDQIYTDTVVALDSFPADTALFYEIDSGPSSMTIGGHTGIIHWIPKTEMDSGNHIITVSSTDRVGQKCSHTYRLHVTAVNDPPVIDSLYTTRPHIYVKDTVKIKAEISDEEHDSLQVKWILNRPVSARTDSTLFYVATDDTIDPYDSIQLIVSDPYNTIAQTIKVLIVNRSIPPQIVQSENSLLSQKSSISWAFPGSIPNPNLDLKTIRYYLILEQAVSGLVNRYAIDSLRSSSIKISDIPGNTRLSSGSFSARVKAFDGKGYSTAWSLSKVFIFSRDSIPVKSNGYEIPKSFFVKFINRCLFFYIPKEECPLEAEISVFDINGRSVFQSHSKFSESGVFNLNTCLPKAFGTYIIMVKTRLWSNSFRFVAMKNKDFAGDSRE